jgi:hypothetical protein
MNNFLKFSLFFIFYLNSILCDKEKKKKLKPFNETLLKWAKKNNIEFSDKIILNFSSINYKTFYAKEDIPENETILKVPFDIILTAKVFEEYSPEFLINIYSDLKNYTSFSNRIFRTPTVKEQTFMCLNLIYAFTHKKKSKLYKLYKPYFQTFENNFDYFPLLYGGGEINLLNTTNFGAKIYGAKKSIYEEIKYIQKNYSYESLINDDYIKYRIITVSKSYNLKGGSGIVPFADFFPLELNTEINNVIWNFDNETNIFYIKSIRNISKGETLKMKCFIAPNSRYLMYYGITFDNNSYIEPFRIKYLHSKLKEEIKLKSSVMNPNIDDFDLSLESFIGDTMDNYRNMGIFFDMPNNDDTGYILMLKNLKYYMEEYNTISDSDYYKKIILDKNRINIKRIVNLEKSLLQKRINLLQEIVDDRMKDKKSDL